MQTLVGKISQSGGVDGEITVVLLHNPFDVTITKERLNQGEYKLTSDRAIFNYDMPPRWYTANSSGDRYAVSQVTPTEIIIQSFDAAGEAEDNRLSGNLFEIEIY